MSWWGWIIAGAILLGAELAFVNAQFYLVFVGSAAILTGLATLAAPLAAWLQWALFGVLAIVSMLTFRSRIYLRFHRDMPSVSTGPAGGVLILKAALAAGASCQAEHARVTRRMKGQITPHPLQIGMFGPERQVTRPHPLARHLEQARRSLREGAWLIRHRRPVRN